jgi:DNA-binding NarL/FixJ family response regulator
MAAFANGAQSFIMKSEPIETIVGCIELVCRGAAAFSLPAASLIMAKAIVPANNQCLSAPVYRGLTPREIEILQLIARGHTDSEIGGMLALSSRTVQRHVQNILNKANSRNRSQAIAQVLGAAPPLAGAANNLAVS